MFLKKVNIVKSHFHICQVKIMLLLLLLLLWQWSIKNNANNAGIFLSSVKPECRERQASAPTTLQANAWAAVRTLRQDIAFRAQTKTVKHNNTFSTCSIECWHCQPASKFSYSSVANCVRKLPTLLYRVLTKVFDSTYDRVFLILAEPSSQMEQLLAATLATPFLTHEVCFKSFVF